MDGKDSGWLGGKQGGGAASTVAVKAHRPWDASLLATAQGSIASALKALEMGRLDLAQEKLLTLQNLLKEQDAS